MWSGAQPRAAVSVVNLGVGGSPRGGTGGAQTGLQGLFSGRQSASLLGEAWAARWPLGCLPRYPCNFLYLLQNLP